MLSFSKTLLFALGFSAIVTSGAGLNINQLNPFSVLTNPQQLSPATNCAANCYDQCTMSRLMCVNIPGLVDCADNENVCRTTCDSECQCISDCIPDCGATFVCADKTDSLEQATCIGQRTGCVKTCQDNCRTNAVMDILTSSLVKSVNIADQYLQGTGTAAPADIRK